MAITKNSIIQIYKYGKIEGTVKIYYDNSKVMEEGLYKNGLRDGVSKWYDQEGKLTIEYQYKNGELVKK
jgi:antitoxin component YwqK of YwqJK toxin-antitoxin module